MKVIMTGGGTGGHIYPAVAIADKIKKKYQNVEIIFVGTKKGLESDIIPACGYEMRTITVSGFNRKKPYKNLGTIKKLFKGLAEANKIINDFKPDFVIGTGGYVCGPVVFAAHLKGIKTFIHEQNAFPGVTNKILSRFSDLVFISFEESRRYFKKKDKVFLTGNPLREAFVTQDLKTSRSKLKIQPEDFIVICFGGSRGAEKINENMINVIEVLNNIKDIRLFFITGKSHYETIIKKIEDKGIKLSENIQVLDYVNNMSDYMAASHLVISRAGALTISEINATGKPSILIPSPNVTGNHQFHNAKVAADRGAAYIIEEKKLNEEKIISIIFKLKNNVDLIRKMASCSKAMSHIDAANRIVEHISQYVYK